MIVWIYYIFDYVKGFSLLEICNVPATSRIKQWRWTERERDFRRVKFARARGSRDSQGLYRFNRNVQEARLSLSAKMALIIVRSRGYSNYQQLIRVMSRVIKAACRESPAPISYRLILIKVGPPPTPLPSSPHSHPYIPLAVSLYFVLGWKRFFSFSLYLFFSIQIY